MSNMNAKDWITLGGLGVAGVLMIATFAFLGGDNAAGIVRSVDLRRPAPEQACVVAAVRSVSGVTDITRCSYEAGDAGGSIVITRTTGGTAQFEMSVLDVHPGDPSRNFTAERIARIRGLMDRIYSALAKQCGPFPPATLVVEACEELSCSDQPPSAESPP